MENYRLLEHIVLEHDDFKVRNAAGHEQVCPKNLTSLNLMMVL